MQNVQNDQHAEIMSVTEISKATGIPERQVTNLLRKALKKLYMLDHKNGGKLKIYLQSVADTQKTWF